MARSLTLSSEGMVGAVVPAGDRSPAGGLAAAGWEALADP